MSTQVIFYQWLTKIQPQIDTVGKRAYLYTLCLSTSPPKKFQIPCDTRWPFSLLVQPGPDKADGKPRIARQTGFLLSYAGGKETCSRQEPFGS